MENGLKFLNYVDTTKFGRRNVIIWRCMTARGVGFARHVEGRINSNHCEQIQGSGFVVKPRKVLLKQYTVVK